MKEINNNISESYCSFEVSKLLKEKGFKIKTCFRYNPNYSFENESDDAVDWNSKGDFISKPTHALAIEWIRVNFEIWIGIEQQVINKSNTSFTYKVIDLSNSNAGIDEELKRISMSDEDIKSLTFNSPQEATEAALLYTLQNLIP